MCAAIVASVPPSFAETTRAAEATEAPSRLLAAQILGDPHPPDRVAVEGLTFEKTSDSRLRINAGEANGPFPVWEERVLHQLVNRARAAPADELAGCGTNCSTVERSGTCYNPVAPLTWSYALNRSARFHSDSMGRMNFFGHDTPCVLRSDLGTVYPSSCDGSSTCACSSMSSSTSWVQRVSLFSGSPGGENIAAGYATPLDVFYAWLLEPVQSSASCSFFNAGPGNTNGHRWAILKNGGPSVGHGFAQLPTGYGRYWTGDFGGGSAPSKLVSGAHWTSSGQQFGATIEFWASWYDAAGPTSASLVIDGQTRPMTLTRGGQGNGAWTASVTGLSSSCHPYYFSFRDSSGTVIRYPTTGTFSAGPAGCADWSGCAEGTAPVISGHPQSVGITSGTSTTLSVTASGTGRTYQWYVGSSGNESSPVTGGTGASLVVSPGTTTSYWVKVTNSCGSVNSNTATVTVTCPLPAISGPTSVTITAGTSTTLSVIASGVGLSYQWYTGTSGNTTSPVGAATSSTLNVSPAVTTNYWVRVTNSCGNANSATATVSIAAPSGPAFAFFTVVPCRLIDTRNPNGPFGGPLLAPNAVRSVTASGSCGIPSGASSLAVNVTAVVPGSTGWLTLYPFGAAGPPSTSTLNYRTGRTRANHTIVTLSSDGRLNVYNSGPFSVHFIIDVTGYFQ